MTKSLDEVDAKMKPDLLSAARRQALKIATEMTLAEIRKARGLNQADIAGLLAMAQPNVSQLENRQDMLLSTLDNYVRALGGKLELHAVFADGQDIRIGNPA